jgi:hypothetical protein
MQAVEEAPVGADSVSQPCYQWFSSVDTTFWPMGTIT